MIRDRFAVSERPGGFAPNHRRVRRQEEIIWLRVQGFDRVISLLPSPHNLHAYDEGELVWAHYPLVARDRPPAPSSRTASPDLRNSLAAGQRVIMHQEELGDRVMGVARRVPRVVGPHPRPVPQAVAMVEHMIGPRQMGPAGRELPWWR